MRLDTILSRTKLEPRPYQRRIANKVVQMFSGKYKENNNGSENTEPEQINSVMIELSTGAGKTACALLSLKTLQTTMPDLVVGWTAMRRNLLAQAARENIEKGINVENIHFVSMFDSYPEELVKAKKEGKRVCLVSDEGHHYSTDSMTHLYNLINPDFVLGLSATPYRTDHAKLCFQKQIKEAGIKSLVMDGFLSPYHHYSVDDWKPETVAKTYLREPERWGKSAVYFKDLALCAEFHRYVQEAGHQIEFITGASDREAQIERFMNSSDCQVIVNCMVLTEGFDFPGLQTVFLRDSSKLPTVQMGGRVLRKYPSLPFKQIVQSKLTRWPFLRTCLPQQQFLWQDNSWLSLTINEKIDLINYNALRAIVKTEVEELPKFLKDRPKRARKVRF